MKALLSCAFLISSDIVSARLSLGFVLITHDTDGGRLVVSSDGLVLRSVMGPE